MAIIILKDIVLTYGERDLFAGISADFQEDQKIGIVGRNGAGKSTLLKVIAGQQRLDEGSVVLNKQKKIAFLPQEVVLNSDKTVFDELFLVFERFTQLEEEQQQIEQQMSHKPSDAEALLDRYQHILDALSHFDRTDSERRAINVLQGLGFTKEAFNTPVNTLSVGWKMRLVLAKLLLEQADFYLFDEPTNHLDIVTKEWFLEFLRNAPFGYLLVSHDRHFLDKACDWIFELSRGNSALYHGNYTNYVALYEARKADQLTAYNLQQKEIARKKDTINRFRASASKAKMAQSMIKQLNKIELITVEPPEPTVSLSFSSVERAGRVVLTVKDVAYQYGEKKLFQHASCEILRDQKVALIAANGTGKSTLFDLIAGKLPLQTGSITFGHNVHFALFEQDQTKALNQSNTVLEEITIGCPEKSTQAVRSFLGAFLFIGDDVYKKINMLSGGEKNRVAMVKALLQDANFLLLDEPTNHLDLYAKSVLLQALKQYPGTILFVSHDHQFVQELATDILELTPQGLYYYPGRYEDFLVDKKKKQDAIESVTQAKNKPTITQATQPQDVKKTIRNLERTIHNLEQRISKKSEQLGEHEYGSLAYEKALGELTTLQSELERTTAEWERLAS